MREERATEAEEERAKDPRSDDDEEADGENGRRDRVVSGIPIQFEP